VIVSAAMQVPMEWFDKDESELWLIVEQLLKRRAKTSWLLAETIRNCPTSFQHWQKPGHDENGGFD